MPGAVVRIDSVRTRKVNTTPDGLSFCPMKRAQQYQELTSRDKEELHKIMTGKSEEDDGE